MTCCDDIVLLFCAGDNPSLDCEFFSSLDSNGRRHKPKLDDKHMALDTSWRAWTTAMNAHQAAYFRGCFFLCCFDIGPHDGTVRTFFHFVENLHRRQGASPWRSVCMSHIGLCKVVMFLLGSSADLDRPRWFTVCASFCTEYEDISTIGHNALGRGTCPGGSQEERPAAGDVQRIGSCVETRGPSIYFEVLSFGRWTGGETIWDGLLIWVLAR